MYFDLGDYRPDTPTVDRAMSTREGVLLSIAVHAVLLLVLLFAPQLPFFQRLAQQAREAAEQQALERQRPPDDTRFVFVDSSPLTAPKNQARVDLSDRDSAAMTMERPPDPNNRLPFSRGTSPDPSVARPVERSPGRGPSPEPGRENRDATPDSAAATPAPAPQQQEERRDLPLPTADRGFQPDSVTAARQPSRAQPTEREGGSLGNALKNLQKYVQEQPFENRQGGAGEFGPMIQFDTKGVEFGPWIRRFIAQVKRNWFVPYAAMSLKGHVVLSFNVHRDGTITDLTIVQPSSVAAFNHAAFNALASSSPTQPLPPEYPTDTAFFTVTFLYNESPPVTP